MAQPTSKVYTSRHATVTLKDGTGSPITATAGPGPGDMTLDPFEEANTAATKVLNRGDYMEMVYGEDNEVSFSITVHQVGDLTGESILDAINKTGNFASGITVDPGGVVWALDVVVTMVRDGVTNVFTLSTCRLKASWSEALEGNKFSISGVCYEGIAVT
jgi:hypothetical protein